MFGTSQKRASVCLCYDVDSLFVGCPGVLSLCFAQPRLAHLAQGQTLTICTPHFLALMPHLRSFPGTDDHFQFQTKGRTSPHQGFYY